MHDHHDNLTTFPRWARRGGRGRWHRSVARWRCIAASLTTCPAMRRAISEALAAHPDDIGETDLPVLLWELERDEPTTARALWSRLSPLLTVRRVRAIRHRPVACLRPVAVVTIPRRQHHRRAHVGRGPPSSDSDDDHHAHRVAGTTASPAPAALSATPAPFTMAAA